MHIYICVIDYNCNMCLSFFLSLFPSFFIVRKREIYKCTHTYVYMYVYNVCSIFIYKYICLFSCLFIYIYIHILYTPSISSTAPHPIPPHSLLVEGLAVGNLTGQVRGQKDQPCGHIHRLSTAVVVHAGAPDLKAVRQQDETHQKDHLTQSPLGRRGRWKWTHRFL